MTHYIIASPPVRAGLGNRIKCLVSCLSICDQIENSQLLLGWSKSDNFNCEVHDLFENDFMLFTEVKEQIKNQQKSHDEHKVTYVNTWRLISSLDEISMDPKIRASQPSKIDCKYHSIEPKRIESLLPYFDRLKIKKTIRDRVDTFAQKFDQNTISIALRTWADCEERQYLFKIDKVYSMLDRYPNAQFFISCDSAEVLDQIKTRYGQQVLSYPVKVDRGERNSKEGIQDALIECLLLSKNSLLKASRMSTFSEVAWWFGGCKAEVELI